MNWGRKGDIVQDFSMERLPLVQLVASIEYWTNEDLESSQMQWNSPLFMMHSKGKKSWRTNVDDGRLFEVVDEENWNKKTRGNSIL